jgi:VWFA-related protein
MRPIQAMKAPARCILAGTLGWSLIAAQAQDATNTLHVYTRIVVLDVVVTDKSGNVVDDLTKDDFTVLEDGHPQTIRSFEPPAKHMMPADITINSAADLDHKAPDAPIDIIVLDEFNTRFTDMDFARYSVKKYINAQPQKLNQPTELVAVNNQKFDLLHDYTQDGSAILASLNKHLTLYPWDLVNNRTGRGTLDRLALTLGALEQVAQATKGHPGHKNVIWVGHGFPGINTVDLTPEQTTSITGAIQRVLDMLRDARITLYTIDPTEVATTVTDPVAESDAVAEDDTGQDPFAAGIGFTALAPATGGKAYYSRNDVDREIGTSIRDGSNFYTLSYSPSNNSEAAAIFRNIKIQLDRRGLKATTRTGYYAQPASTTPAMVHNQTAFDITSAASTKLVYDGLQVEAKPVEGESNTFLLTIGQRGLVYKESDDGSQSAEVVIETASFGAKDKFLARTLDGVTIKAQPLNNGAAPEPAKVKAKAKIPPGTTRLRFVVRDSASGQIGTVDLSVH